MVFNPDIMQQFTVKDSLPKHPEVEKLVSLKREMMAYRFLTYLVRTLIAPILSPSLQTLEIAVNIKYAKCPTVAFNILRWGCAAETVMLTMKLL